MHFQTSTWLSVS